LRGGLTIGVAIPALDEEQTIAGVIDAIPDWVDRVVVGDNGSIDRTAEIAQERGAEVVHAARRGYGTACRAALEALAASSFRNRSGDETTDAPASDVVVFVDGDLADDPAEMARLVDPIVGEGYDLVIGSRVLGELEPGALTVPQRFGNALSCLLTRAFFGVRYTDLGPFRAALRTSFDRMEIRDPHYGWTIRPQVRAARFGLRVKEVPVSYRKRAGGRSKVSGTLRGVIGAGAVILSVIFGEALAHALSRGAGRAGPAPQRR
jgi:glycosyltransferase involved in cell wall biosynthesis